MTTTAPQSLATFPDRYFAAWNDGDLGVVAGLLAETFTWTDPLLPEPLTTLAGAHGFFQGTWQGFPDIRFELVGEVLVDEARGRVAAEWRMTGSHQGEFPPGVPGSGSSFDLLGTDVFTVDAEGRATEIRAYYDSVALLRQIGQA